MSRCKKALAVLLAAAMMALGACAASPSDDANGAGMSGGDAALGSSVNLRDVSIEMQGDETLVHLSFVNGSRYAGVEESKLSSVPKYEITELSDPSRICASLAIGFTDYTQSGTVFQESLVAGLFHCNVAGSTMTQVYLQLSAPANLKCSADGSTLTFILSPKQQHEESAWFVGLNAIAQYENGLVPEDLGFTPTMCSDYSHQILVSGPVKSEEEAQAVLGETEAALPSAILESALYAFEMEVNSLPPYETVAGSELAASVAVMEVNGEPASLPTLLDDGKYLTTASDGTIVYAVPYLPDAQQDTELLVKEELWAEQTDSSRVRLGSSDFYDIREAVFSSDGTRLGILDARPTDQVLFVYDTQTGALLNLGEEGLGNSTTSFVWDPHLNVIYAMTGTDGELQLLRYDFDAPEGTPRVSSVEERPGSDSTLAIANGTLYFADQSTMNICAVDIATGQRRTLAPGVSLRLSGNGQYLAVLVMRPADEEEVAFDLVLLDAETGEQKASVVEGAAVEDYMFSADSDILYYTTQNYEGVTTDYPFALLRYSVSDGENQLMAYSKSELIDPGPEAGILYVVYYFTSGDTAKDMLPVTYEFLDG